MAIQILNRKKTELLKANRNKRVVLLELGVGFNTPTIVLFPFEKMVREDEKWSLIRLNLNEDIARSIQDIKGSMDVDRYRKEDDCDD